MSDTISLAALSEETGEPVETLLEWRELGLLPGDHESFPMSHVERVRLVQFAALQGIAPDRLAEISAKQGDLLGFLADTLPPPSGRGRSFDEAASALGIDPEVLERFRVAAGLRDQYRAYDEDVEALGWMSAALQAGMPEEAVLQIVRVLADASGRVAEGINRLFHVYVHEAFRAEGKTGAELIASTQAVGEPLQGLVEPAVFYFHRKAWERATREDLLLHLEEEVTAPAPVPGQLTRTILFCDLSGFTPMTEAMGDAVAAGVVDRFSHVVREAAAASQGQVVKQIGDAFMLVFADPKSAVACGLAIDRAASVEPNFPAVRSGAHAGPVLYREADYVGATVNLAARVAAAAESHQLLVTGPVKDAAMALPDVGFSFHGRLELKGVAEPVELFAAESEEQRVGKVADPVCGMEVDPDRAAAQLNWAGKQYWFCSTTCLQRFAEAPERYAT